jgi:hypothetical protein
MSGRALIVSINDFGLLDPSGRSNLNGCLNDGLDYFRLFKWKGFDEIRWLKDREATAQNIMDGCRWLQEGTWSAPDGSKPMDASSAGKPTNARRAYAHSGHGSLDKGRPALCPADLRPDWSNILNYAKLAPLLAFPEGTSFYAAIDACHSGDRMRDLPNMSARFGDVAPRPRFLPPPPEHVAFGAEVTNIGGRAIITPNPDSYRYLCSSDIDVVLAGCQLNQTSADAYINHSYHGAFTYYKMRILEETQCDITYKELVERLNELLAKNGYEQRAQYEGPPEYINLKFMDAPKVTVLDGKPDHQ